MSGFQLFYHILSQSTNREETEEGQLGKEGDSWRVWRGVDLQGQLAPSGVLDGVLPSGQQPNSVLSQDDLSSGAGTVVLASVGPVGDKQRAQKINKRNTWKQLITENKGRTGGRWLTVHVESARAVSIQWPLWRRWGQGVVLSFKSTNSSCFFWSEPLADGFVFPVCWALIW